MCFYQDAEWYASIHEETRLVSDGTARCDECGEIIPAGVGHLNIYQQERECCEDCYDGVCDCPGSRDEDECVCDHECKCEQPNLGQTYTYECCNDCEKFRSAIYAAEIKAGCDHYEAHPPMGEMQQALIDAGEEECEKYFTMADEMHPELRASGYFARMFPKWFAVTPAVEEGE